MLIVSFTLVFPMELAEVQAQNEVETRTKAVLEIEGNGTVI